MIKNKKFKLNITNLFKYLLYLLLLSLNLKFFFPILNHLFY